MRVIEKNRIIQYESMKEFDEILKDEHHISRRSNSSSEGSADFTGTESFSEAEDLRKYGDKKSKDKIIKVKETTDKVFEKYIGQKVRLYNDVVGFQPIVPNAILGLPLSMVNQKRLPKKVKTIDIFYNASIACNVIKEDIELKGAYVLSAIDALERSGYRVNLYIGCISMVKNKPHGYFLNVKKAEQPLNLLKVAYYIVHPSFLRRTTFRICENEKELIDCTHDGYGTNIGFSEQQQVIRSKLGDDTVIIDASTKISTDKSEDKNLALLVDAFRGKLPDLSEDE